MMNAQPQKEHQWLHQLVGNWTMEAEAIAGPDQPPFKSTGIESVRPFGGLWVLCEGRGEMPGGGVANSMMTLGYDPQKERYVGTWIGSMMTHLWVYDGEMDAARKVLTLSAEGPNFAAEGEMAKYRDVIEIVGSDHRTLTSHQLGDDGKWHQFMTAHYLRTK